jgi:predicted nucleotidyltransferase
MKNNYNNIVRIKVLAEAFSSLSNKIVFVGGAVVELYCDDPARAEVRPTNDVDVVVELHNKGSYVVLEEKLRTIGFQNDVFSGVICRYIYHDIVVDIMPDDDSILGFTNIWYKEGLQNSLTYHLDDELNIQIFPLDLFLASKFEALISNRHGDDYRLNSDFEDIVYIFDNRLKIKEEIIALENEVKKYLQASISMLLKRPYIEEEISSNLESSSSKSRKNRILSIWKSIIL